MTVRPTLRDRWAGWWLHELPPLDGRLRLIVYGALLLLALSHWKSPLRGVALYAGTDPALFRPHGLISALGLPWIPPGVLLVIAIVTGVAWLAAAIGLLGRISAIVTAVGAALLHGYCWGSSAFNHNYALPLYVLGALCFAAPDPRWSMDAWIRASYGRPPRPEPRGIGATGFARVLALVFVVTFYFCAGVTKLQTSGLAWADGHTIAYWSEEDALESPAAALLQEQQWLCVPLALLTLIFEVGAPLALGARLRPIFILGWIGMHAGILLIMGPRYYENIVCFALLLDWRAVRQRGIAGLFAPPAPQPVPWQSLAPGARAAVALGTAVVTGALCVALLGVSWWPLSNIYMYSAYYSHEHGIRAGEPLDAYLDPVEAQRIARRFRDERLSFDAKEHLPRMAELRLVSDGAPPLYLPAGVGATSPKQWDLVVELPVLIADLAHKPHGRIEAHHGGPDAPANRFLRDLLPVIRRRVAMWRDYERVELVYQVEDGHVAIGSVPLATEQPPGRG
jgi:hypothetical protein